MLQLSLKLEGALPHETPAGPDEVDLGHSPVDGPSAELHGVDAPPLGNESAAVAPLPSRVATIVVKAGDTDQREYTLTEKLTVIGKSDLATIKLRGWFAPKAAAQISRRAENTYYIGAADKVPVVNGEPVTRPVLLTSGDVIEVAGVRLEFEYRE